MSALSKVEVSLQGQTLFVPSLEDMIKAKEAAGRPQDLLDLEKLKKALATRQKNSSP